MRHLSAVVTLSELFVDVDHPQPADVPEMQQRILHASTAPAIGRAVGRNPRRYADRSFAAPALLSAAARFAIRHPLASGAGLCIRHRTDNPEVTCEPPATVAECASDEEHEHDLRDLACGPVVSFRDDDDREEEHNCGTDLERERHPWIVHVRRRGPVNNRQGPNRNHEPLAENPMRAGPCACTRLALGATSAPSVASIA